MVQRSFMQSGPKILCPTIFMLLLLKHCYLLNCKNPTVIPGINIASICKPSNWQKSAFYPRISQKVQTL